MLRVWSTANVTSNLGFWCFGYVKCFKYSLYVANTLLYKTRITKPLNVSTSLLNYHCIVVNDGTFWSTTKFSALISHTSRYALISLKCNNADLMKRYLHFSLIVCTRKNLISKSFVLTWVQHKILIIIPRSICTICKYIVPEICV